MQAQRPNNLAPSDSRLTRGAHGRLIETAEIDILGLFPSLRSESVGGVEATGRLAWHGITYLQRPKCEIRNAYLFCYGKTKNGQFVAANWNGDDDRASQMHTTICNSSKLGSIVNALTARLRVGVVVVWHLGLLKLLPFFRIRNAKIVLFLHGIEVWKKHGWLTRILLRQVNLFLSNSEYTWQRFLSVHPTFAKAAHETVHLGIGIPVNPPIPFPSERPIALMISRLVRTEDYKGHRQMIAAWPLVLKRLPDAELVFQAITHAG